MIPEKKPMYRGGPLDLDELEALARAATPGPWRSWWEGRDHYSGDSFVGTGRAFPNEVGEGPDLYPRVTITPTGDPADNLQADQDFIAAANPATILELIARIRGTQ